MKPAIFTSFNHDIPFDTAVEMIADAGFEVIDPGAYMQHCDYRTEAGVAGIRKLIDQYRMTIGSMHAPFPEGDRLFSLDDSERSESIRQCLLAVDAAKALDAGVVVIHLIQPYDIPEGDQRNAMIERGRESVRELADYAGVHGVKLAMENGQRAAYDRVLTGLLGELTGEHVGLCYDVGHENVQGTCFNLLEKFGDRVVNLHVHDNTGSDSHVLPFEGNIDWKEFMKVLHRTGYTGNLLLELGMNNSRFKDPVEFLAEAMKCCEKLLQERGMCDRNQTNL